MNSLSEHTGTDIALAIFHLERALECLDVAGELSAAPYAQMALDSLNGLNLVSAADMYQPAGSAPPAYGK